VRPALTGVRWWLAKKISPYGAIAVGLTIRDGTLTLPVGAKKAVVEDCAFVNTGVHPRGSGEKA